MRSTIRGSTSGHSSQRSTKTIPIDQRALTTILSSPNTRREQLRNKSKQASSKGAEPVGRAKSPSQCAEIVFGNITNMERLSSGNSPSSEKQKSRHLDQHINTFDEGRSPGKMSFVRQPIATGSGSQSFSQLTTQQLLKVATCQSGPAASTAYHSRSKTMPEIRVQQSKENERIDDDQISTNFIMSQLRQENMILAAEKSNMQSELVFYKNELAKLCLHFGVKFPVFRQPDILSSLATTQILAKNSSNSYNTGSDNINRDGQMHLNPQLFYNSKHSEDRYVCVSQALIEDQASTTLSFNRQSKKSQDFMTEKHENGQKHENLSRAAQEELSLCKVYMSPKSQQTQETEPTGLMQSPDYSTVNDQQRKSTKAMGKHMNRRSQNDKENVLKRVSQTSIGFNSRKSVHSSQTSGNIPVHQVTVNLTASTKSRQNVPVQSKSQQQNPENEDVTPTSTEGTQRRRKRSERASSRLSMTSAKSGNEKSQKEDTVEKVDPAQVTVMTESIEVKHSQDAISKAVEQIRGKILDIGNNSYASSSKVEEPAIMSCRVPQKIDKEQLVRPCADITSMTPRNGPTQLFVQDETSDSYIRMPPSLTVTDRNGQVQTPRTDCQGTVYSQDTSGDYLMLKQPQPSKSPLEQKEYFLESSQRALQEKLKRVREEIQQLSEAPPSTGKKGSVVVTSPDRFGDSTSTRKQFEEELIQLREQLQNFNIEEQKVMCELEMTRTLRKAHEDHSHDNLTDSIGSSFQLHPLQLNFDGCSQRSIGMLQSPILGTAKLHNGLTLVPLEMTQESVFRHLTTESDQGNQSSRSCAINDRTAGFASNSEANESIKIDDQQRLSQQSIQPESPAAQPEEYCDYKQIPDRTALSLDMKRLEDSLKNRSCYMTQPGCTNGAGLWINQIIEEDHESESAADNSAQGHSRQTSNNVPNLKQIQQQIIEYGDQAKTKINHSQRSSLDKEILSSLYSSIVQSGTQSSLFDPQSDIKQINKADDQENDDYLLSKANTLKRFEKLIQDTQQSDEACLLKHIQKNLEQLKTSEDFHLANLKQQQSPSPLKMTLKSNQQRHTSQASLNTKYLEDTQHSHDTQKLIQEFQEEVTLKAGLDGEKFLKEVTGGNTQMSETIQFMVAAGQTGTTQPIPSFRSSVDSTQQKQKLPMQNRQSRNGFSVQQTENSNGISAKSAPSINNLRGECQIRILQNPGAADTMSSAQQNQFSSMNSIERLSKASPCFQQHSTFEGIKQFPTTQSKNGDNISEHRSFIDNFESADPVFNKGRSIFDDKQQRLSLSSSMKSEDVQVHVQDLASPDKQDTSRDNSHHLINIQSSNALVEQQQVTFHTIDAAEETNLVELGKATKSSSTTRSKYPGKEKHVYRRVSETQAEQEPQPTTPILRSIQSEASLQSPINQRNITESRYFRKSQPAQVDEKDQTTPARNAFLKKSASQATLNSARPTVYGNKRINDAAQSYRAPKTQLAMPGRAHGQSASTQQFLAHNESVVAQNEQRSSYNLYKRNSVKIAKTPVDEQTKGMADSTCSQVPQGHRQHARRIDVSDNSTLMHHAASQSTLNLEQRSPFNSQAAPVQVGMAAKFKTADPAANTDEAQQRLKKSHSQGFGSVPQTVTRRKCEASFDDYINGKCELEPHARQKQIGAQPSCQTSDPTRQQLSDAGRIVKTKSLSCLGGQTSSGNSSSFQPRPSPGLYQRNQMTTLSGIVSKAPMSSRESGFSTLSATVGRKNSARIGPNVVQTQRSSGTMGSSKYLTRLGGDQRAGSTASGDILRTSNNVVVLSEQSTAPGGQQDGKTTPSYMQPIQKKFKKQTIQMVRDRTVQSGLPHQQYKNQSSDKGAFNTVRQRAGLRSSASVSQI